MNYDPFVEQINQGLIENSRELFNAALETMVAKNSDYSGKATDMKNFRISAEVANVKMSQGILTRLMDKMTRVGNLLNKDEAAVKGESVYDTLQDAINYTAILYYAILIEDQEKIS